MDLVPFRESPNGTPRTTEWNGIHNRVSAESALTALTMKLLKPNWISHDGKPVFSLDIHPDGSRFATGGQGEDSGRVIIWNMAPVRSASDEMNPDVPKMLCEMSNHLGCVNCVRWSVDGRWLASGGDDTIVMIWQIKFQGVGQKMTFGTNHEQWGCVHMLRGHNGDVLDLSWSPDCKYLASCSVDNNIVIWNAKSLPQKCAIISGHNGLVKGLTWDPVGKYIASQSDDRSVRIWRTTDWREEKQITHPFKRCGGTTHVLRLSWSPDGKYLVSAHALNNDGPTAQIIERGDWKAGMDFVGHRKAVEVVCFNPHLFMRNSGADNHGCLAIGSRDRSLSVWLTHLKRPLVVTHDLFNDSILDLSWSADGYELMVCSTDGSVAYICFSEKELGVPLSKQAIDDLYITTYGCKHLNSRSSLNVSSDVLIEDPEMLKLHAVAEKNTGAAPQTSTPSKEREKESTSNISNLNQSMELISDSAKQATITQQVETRTKDGRRRITPVMLASQPSSLSGAPLPFTSFSPNKNKARSVTPLSSSKERPEQAALKSPPPKPISFEPLSPNSKVADSKPEKRIGSEPEGQPLATAKSTSATSSKRQLELSATELPRAKRLKKTKAAVEPAKPSTPQRVSHLSSKLPTLPVPEAEQNVTIQVTGGGVEREPLLIELDNSLAGHCTVTSRRGDVTVWSASLPSQGLLAAGNQFITCVACKDKTVAVYSTQSGRLLLAKFAIPSLPHAMKVNMHYVMVVTSSAQVSVWDMLNMRATVKEASFSHLLEGGKQLQNTSVTKFGVPVLSINTISYLFHKDMDVWMEVSNSSEHSDIQGVEFGINSSSESTTAPLYQIQQSASTRCDSIGQMLSSLRGSSNPSATLTYLESQISRSLCLQSPLEYQHWTKSYVRYLVKQNLEERLREFCSKFTGPSDHSTVVLGFPRELLLRDFLVVIAANAKLQRLYCELRDSLGSS